MKQIWTKMKEGIRGKKRSEKFEYQREMQREQRERRKREEEKVRKQSTCG